MAGKNDVIANVRVQVGGVEASKKNLEAIRASADSLKTTLADLVKQRDAFVSANDLANADKTVKKIRETETALKSTQQLYKSLEKEVGNYENVLENLSGTTMQKLNLAARNLQQQMKQQLTAEDIGRWKQLSDAYKEVMQQIEQLSGKAPNLGYVMQNLGSVSAKSLKDTDEYLKRLIADTDQGSTKLTELQAKMRQVQAEQQARLQTSATTAISDVSGGAFNGNTLQAKEAIATLQQYKDTLNLTTQVDEVNRVTQAMDVYNAALGKVQKTAVDVTAVLRDPRAFSTEQIQEAIKQLEEQAKKIKIGDSAQVSQVNDQIRQLQETLAASQQEALGIDNIVAKAGRGEASILEMEKAVAALNERLKNTPRNQTQEIERLRQQLDVLNPALAQTQFSMTRVNETMGNLKGSNISSLKEAAAALETKMKDVNYQMDQFAEDASKLKAVKAQIKEVESAWSTTTSQLDKAIDRLRNWVVVYAGFSKMAELAQQAMTGSLALSDSMADVQKTTGLAAEEVARLTDLVQSLDTRVSNEKLMEAATEAGRIGLKTQEDVFKFTKSSSIVLTALDELDARAITSVMKLNTLLGETARLGVDNAMLSTASSINELSQASSAAAGPIINFSRRFGGVASQANISTDQVLALGATLDALGQPVEMSSTAMNKFTTALLSNGKQIAQDTGLSEDYIFQMTRQGKTIEVMIEVLSKLNTMGGIGEISKYMGDMGGDGARMTAVIAALSSNLGFMREQLSLSSEAFQEGTSVIEEYNVKNENAAALVARMGNDIKEAFVNSQTVAVLTDIVRVMQQFVSFMFNGSAAAKVFNLAMILVIAKIASAERHVKAFSTSMVAMGRNMLLSIHLIRTFGISMISFSGILKAVGAAIKGLFAGNPLGWIVIGVGLLSNLISWLRKTEDATKDTRSAIDRANEAFEEEQYKLSKLKKELDLAKGAKQSYAAVVSALNKDYGKHIGYMLDESDGYERIADAIDLATAAKRRSILEDEKMRNFRDVQDEYRDPINLSIKTVKTDLQDEFRGFSESFTKDLYSAINLDLQRSAEYGNASLGKSVAETLRNQAKAMGEIYRKNSPSLSDADIKKKEDTYFKEYTERISRIKTISNLAKQYTDRAKEVSSRDSSIQDDIINIDKNTQEMRQKSVARIREDIGLLGDKSVGSFTAKEEKDLEKVASLYDNILANINEHEDPEGWAAASKNLDNTRALQRDVLLAFADNPMKGVKMKVGDDGKFYKDVSESGKEQYQVITKMSEANLQDLQSSFRRAGEVFDKLTADQNNLMDSKVKEQAKKLSKLQSDIKKELKKNGLEIDEKGNIKLSSTEYVEKGGASRSENQEEKAMKKAYEALLKNLQEYFDRRKQMVNQGYLSDQLTTEQHNRMLDEIDREHQQVRIDMQGELLGEGERFNEQVYIRDQANFRKVLGWMGKDTHQFQDTVRADMESGSRKIQDDLIKHKDEIEKILLKNQVFEALSRQYQQQLEKLQLFFMKTSDLGEENFKGMQQRAADVMSMLSKAGVETMDMSYETFRNMVAKYNETSGILLTTQGKDGKQMLAGAEDEWKAIYQIVTAYNNDISEARIRMFNENSRMIDKLLEQDERYKRIAEGKKSLETERTEVGFRSDSSDGGKRELFNNTRDLLISEMALEEAAYLNRERLTQEFYDNKIAAAKENSQSTVELERMKHEELRNIERDYNSRSTELSQELTGEWLNEYDRRSAKVQEYGERMGEFLGTMASADWNSVEDRKRAGRELIEYIAKETAEYIRQLLIRQIREKAISKQTVAITKATQVQKIDITEQGGEELNVIAGRKARGLTGIEADLGNQLTDIAANTAVEGATNSVKKASVDTAAGGASAAAKILGEMGFWGIPLIGVVTATLSALLSTAMGSLSSTFGKSVDTGASNKRLATGMLTYAEGRYPVTGNDGVTYDAQYEPVLKTGIYDGGKGGKAHFGIFSEKMPEMVVSGPTTKLMQENYPWMAQQIYNLEKHGRLQGGFPTFARGNVGRFMPGFDAPADMIVDEGGNYIPDPQQQKQMMETLNANTRVMEMLEKRIAGGINATIRMYGKEGLMEQTKKAEKFYTKNKIK